MAVNWETSSLDFARLMNPWMAPFRIINSSNSSKPIRFFNTPLARKTNSSSHLPFVHMFNSGVTPSFDERHHTFSPFSVNFIKQRMDNSLPSRLPHSKALNNASTIPSCTNRPLHS
ncbi:hypothetical protein LguiB_034130 [Lonicera macranthoides]